MLASHTWYKVFWQYLNHFNVTLELDESVIVPKVRERDRVFMEEVVTKMDRADWLGINRVRKHMKVYFFSQLAYCDGLSVRDSVIDGESSTPSTIEFSYEEPTAADRRT